MELLLKYVRVKKVIYAISRNMRTLYWVYESGINVVDFFDYLMIRYLLNIKIK